MAESFPNLMEKYKPVYLRSLTYTQAQKNNWRIMTLRFITIKLLETNDKEKILKIAREKRYATQRKKGKDAKGWKQCKWEDNGAVSLKY